MGSAQSVGRVLVGAACATAAVVFTPFTAAAAVFAGGAAAFGAGALVTAAIQNSANRDPTHAPNQAQLVAYAATAKSLSTQQSANASASSDAKHEGERIDRETQEVMRGLSSIAVQGPGVQRLKEELQQKASKLEEDKKANTQLQTTLNVEGTRLSEAKAEVLRKEAEIREINARDWPRPAWLRNGCHVGITGRTGAGKSSLINAVLGEKVAEVGVTETTLTPAFYTARKGLLTGLVLCDMPGAGTEKFPAHTYIKNMGIRYFYTLLIVTHTRFEETDYMLFHEARRWEIPCYLVRSKVDSDIENNLEDHGWPAEETVAKIRDDLIRNIRKHPTYTAEDDSRVFVVSSKRKFEEALLPELQRLMATLLKDIVERSGTSVDELSRAVRAAQPALGADSAASLAEPQPAMPEERATVPSAQPGACTGSYSGAAGPQSSTPSFAMAAAAAGSVPSCPGPGMQAQSDRLWKKAESERAAPGM